MGKTVSAFNLDSTSWTPHVAHAYCRKIIACEVNQAGTVDYYISPIGADADKRARPAGKEYIFESA